jgi:hypothetical protein
MLARKAVIPIRLAHMEGYSGGCVEVQGDCSDVEFIGRGDVVEKRLYQQRSDCRDSAADRGLRDAVVLSDFRLDPVPAQIGQGYGERIVQPEYRRPSAHPWRKLAASILAHTSVISALVNPVV